MHYHHVLGFFYLYIGEVPDYIMEVFTHANNREKMLVSMNVYHDLPTGSLLAIRDFQ